jgi:pyruvate dehydrogenase E1 component beta subunit
VFVVLNKLSLALTGPVPEGPYTVPIGVANVARAGSNYTIVTFGRMLHEALKAAEELASLGVDAEVIDARSVQPFDTDTVVASVRKTHRAMVVHEAVRFGGIGGEVAAQIQELAFDWLDAPVARVGAPFAPVPFSPVLEKTYMPNAARIVAAAREQLGV